MTGATSAAVGAAGGAGVGSGSVWDDAGGGRGRGAAIPCCTVGCEIDGWLVVTGGAAATVVEGEGETGAGLDLAGACVCG